MYGVFLSIPAMCLLNSFFATCDERFVIDCTVILYIQSKELLFVCNLTLLGYDKVLEKHFGFLEKSWNFFVIKRVGNLDS